MSDLLNDAVMLPWQAKVLQDDHRFRVLAAGRRSGKSFLMLIMMLQHALSNPNNRVVFVGRSHPSVRESVFIPFKKIIERKAFIERVNNTTSTVNFTNGSTIIFASSENPDGLRGSEADFMTLDEIDYWSHDSEEIFMEILMPMISRSQGKVVFASTPKGMGGFLYKLSLKAEQYPDLYSFHHTTAYEAGNVPKSEIDLQKSMLK